LTSEYKEYIAEFELGYETDTLDITGKIIHSCDIKPSYQNIQETIMSFMGKYNQEVPKYSAVKINGKKLYEYARNNEDVIIPSRLVDIKEIEVLSIGDVIKIRCLVSKGTYIRSLIRDIGYRLNTYATMTSLIRSKSGNFNIENSYKLVDIKNNNYNFISIEEIFKDYPKINISEEEYKKISNGNKLDNIYNSEYVLFYYNNKLICIYKEYEKSKIKPYIFV